MKNKTIDLAELQMQFADSLQKDKLDTLNSFIAKREPLSADAQLDLYRNNSVGVLSDNLKHVYPTVLSIVGEAFFNTLVRHYIPLNPSRSGDLRHYGENFADFVSHYPAAESMPYLPDVAQLDWRWHQVYHAADDATYDMNKLAQVKPEEYGRLFFVLAQASALVQSDYPLLDIWQVSQTENSHEARVDLDSAEHNVLMLRTKGEIHLHLISDAEVVFIESLAEAYAFADAFEKASAEGEFDIQASLQKLIQFGLIVDSHVSQSE